LAPRGNREGPGFRVLRGTAPHRRPGAQRVGLRQRLARDGGARHARLVHLLTIKVEWSNGECRGG